MKNSLTRPDKDLESKLRTFEANRKYFLTVSQAARCLGFTVTEVRYAISFYRLDALFVAGEYRIATDWIRSFSRLLEEEDCLDFYNVLRYTEITGVHALVFNGEVQPLVASLNATNRPLHDMCELVKKSTPYEYYKMPGDEEDPMDWYDIDRLSFLPVGRASVNTWAQLLNITPARLSEELGIKSSTVDYPTMYDYMVEREVINLPCPFNTLKKPHLHKAV